MTLLGRSSTSSNVIGFTRNTRASLPRTAGAKNNSRPCSISSISDNGNIARCASCRCVKSSVSRKTCTLSANVLGKVIGWDDDIMDNLNQDLTAVTKWCENLHFTLDLLYYNVNYRFSLLF
jgi:hypothetical protein